MHCTDTLYCIPKCYDSYENIFEKKNYLGLITIFCSVTGLYGEIEHSMTVTDLGVCQLTFNCNSKNCQCIFLHISNEQAFTICELYGPVEKK